MPDANDRAVDPAFQAPLMEALRDATNLFTTLHIPYALIGGIAAMVYGRSRFTEDVDFVAAALYEEILAAHKELMRACHFESNSTRKLFHDSGIEIDIWKDAFSDLIAVRAKPTTLADQSVMIAEVHDLLAMKLRAGRLQDDYDISEILKHTAVDESILKQRVTAEEFSRFEDVKKRMGRGFQ